MPRDADAPNVRGEGTARPLRVAVVGPGGWGRQHVRIFSGRPDTELVAIVGRDPDRTKLPSGA